VSALTLARTTAIVAAMPGRRSSSEPVGARNSQEARKISDLIDESLKVGDFGGICVDAHNVLIVSFSSGTSRP
jgi:hypothetical protein